MTHDRTLKALSEKRAALVREIETHQSAIRQLNSDIDSVDAALRLFGAPMPTKETVRPQHRKETARLIFDALREATGPMTVRALAERILLARQISPEDATLVRAVSTRVRGCLQHYREKGLVVSRENVNAHVEWSLA